MPKFLSCFAPRSNSTAIEDQNALISNDATVETERKQGCIFCDVSVEKGFAVVGETPGLIAFRDRWPRAETHLLIIPRKHVASTVPELRHSDISLLKAMGRLADELMPGSKKLGFHIPPFSSVHHIHLHVLQGKPTLAGKLMYPERQREGGKGWTWFVTLDQALTILESGKQIRLGSSKR